MRTTNSLGNRLLAFALSVVMVLGMLPLNAFAGETTAVAKIGDAFYDTLADAVAAVPTGVNQVAPAEATTVTLLRDTAYAFDVGNSTGATTMNLKLDLNGKTLTLAPSVGSVGTKSNGIRVLAYSKLEIVNGTVLCSSEASDNVKAGIANYGELVLDNVALKAGAQTIYTVNNRGALTLKGNTSITAGSTTAITNDPYNLYYTSNVDASVTCDSSEVSIESILVERYERNSANKGSVKLNLSAGYFGKIVEDGNDAVGASYHVTGGVIGVSSAEELDFALKMVKAGAEYSAPEKPVTIKLLGNLAGSFDVGSSNGKAPKNICLDLNGYTLTLRPGIGSFNTETNGIRVLAYSKLEVKNGTLLCSSEAADKVKVGIANYSELVLDNVALKAGAQTIYTVNNRGALTLKGNTSITAGSTTAITNDPYNLYYTSDVDASVTCASSDVSVESVLVERYERNSANKGGVKLNISAGYFGKIEEDGASSVDANYAITGGSFGSDISDFCSDGYETVEDENGNFVVKSTQTNFGFDNDEYTVAFGANGNKFTSVVKNAMGEVTYSVVSGADVAKIDAKTGELTIYKPGTVVVKAVAAGNAQYVAAEDTYTLVIEAVYAEVHSFSGGTVTGSGTADTVVSIDNAVLEWVAKDESIGRPQDGWWVGIKIVAPDGVDLSKAVYQRRSGGSFDGAEVKPFIPESDRYMGMWGLITAEYLENFSNSGKKLNYVWRFDWDGDDVYEQTIAITVDPAGITLEQSGFAFAIEEDKITYGEAYTAALPSGGQANEITYSVDNTNVAEIDEKTGVLTVKTAGKVEITATLSGNHYKEISDSYTLEIQKATQPDFGFAEEEVKITYSVDGTYTQEATGALGTGDLTYKITSELYDGVAADVADIDEKTGEVTVKQSGVVTIQATKAGDHCYEEAQPATYTLEIAKAEQTGLAFAKNAEEVTYNDDDNKYTATATGGQSAKDVVYSTSDSNMATVDATTGEVTIAKAGVVEITATKPADEKYEESTAKYSLKIHEDTQEFVAADTFKQNVPVVYGTAVYSKAVELKEPHSGNPVVYSISDSTFADIDSATGEVIFKDHKVGSVTVTASVAGKDGYYEPAESISYTITVDYLAAPAQTPVFDTKWHTQTAVTVNAPTGYTVSKTGKLAAEDWATSVSFGGTELNDSADNQVQVYLREDETGYITNAIDISGIKVDTQAPTALSIDYAEPKGIVNLLEKIGIFQSNKQEVTISATDATSGIASLTYNIGDGNGDVTVEAKYLSFDGNKASYTFAVEEGYRGKITMKALDAAGWSTEKSDDKIIVLDTTAPDFLAPGYVMGTENEYRWEDNVLYSQKDVTLQFTLAESNADLSGLELEGANGQKTPMPVLEVKKNGNPVDVDNVNWSFAAGKLSGSYALTGEGDYVVKLTYTDAAGNVMDAYEQKIHIDATAPVITVTDKADEAAFAGEISSTEKTAVLTIIEHNFKSSEVAVAVVAKNILDENVQVMNYTAFAKAANWQSSGDVHTLELPLTEDAVYDIEVSYADLARRTAQCKDSVTVDTKAATNPKISHKTPVSQLLLQGITLGFYKAKTQVTVTAEDITSGVNTIELTYNKVDNTTETVNLPVQQDGKVFTGVYDLEPQADGSFSAVITDKAGNPYTVTDTNNRLIVDSEKPEITVAYKTVGNETVGIFRNAAKNPVNSFAEATQVYYDGAAKATVTIDEHYFFEGVTDDNGKVVHEVLIQVTRTDENGNKTVTEYLPEGAAPLLPGDVTLSRFTWTTQGDLHTMEIPFGDDGDYQVKIAYADFSGNDAEIAGDDGVNAQKTYVSKLITVDTVDPEITVLNPQTDAILGANHTVRIQIDEHNFDAKDVELVVTAKNILDQNVAVMDYTAEARKAAKWTSSNNGNTHTLELLFDVDAVYDVKVNYSDLSGNKAEEKTDAFTVDKTDADAIAITYSTPLLRKVIETLTFGFYQAEVEVTVTAEDLTSGVDYFELSYIRDETATDAHTDDFMQTLTAQPGADAKTFTASYTVPAQARGSYIVKVFDKAGNVSEATDNTTVIVTDTVDSKVTVKYTNLDKNGYRDADNQVVQTEDAAVTFYNNKRVIATITVEEANFFEGKTAGADNNQIVHQMLIKVTKTDNDGVETVTEYLPEGAAQLVAGAGKETIQWTTVDDTHTVSITFADDGDYVLELSYQDFSGNDTTIVGNDAISGNITYASKVITVDKIKPEIAVAYDNNTALNENFYKDNRTATVTVTEHNFKPEEFVVDVTTKNLLGDITVADYAAYATDPANWTHSADNNVHTLKLEFTEDAIYSLDLSYTDMAGNAAEDFAAESFVVDHTAADNIQITYSTPVFSRIINALSFGFYKANVVVTVTAEDLTSGVDYFELSYTRDEAATDAHADDFMQKLEVRPGADAKTFTASYTVPAQARGSCSVKVFDKAGNESSANDNGSVIVTDTVRPGIKIDFAAKKADTKVHFVDADRKDVETFAESANVFFNGDVVTTITVEEANFFEGMTAGADNDEIVHEMIIKVTKVDDEGNKTVTEYLPEGANLTVEGATKKAIRWTTAGDTHTAKINLTKDGDYILEISYRDFSKNNAKIEDNEGVSVKKNYKSRIITVDKTQPVIDVTYGNTDVIANMDDIDYFNESQSAVITVTEHNFRAEDIAAVVTAKTVAGKDIKVADFAAQLADERTWKYRDKDGKLVSSAAKAVNPNEHIAEVTYSEDANYTFDIDFEDLAQNASADYAKDLFTVDTTAPEDLKIEYSQNVFDVVLNKVFFGYYDAKMTVDISATDDVSGINYFVYSYLIADDVSSVNAQKENETIAPTKVEGNRYKASFKIPMEKLKATNQFNGSVNFTAYDRSANSTIKDDAESVRIIVDSIAPTGKITYNKPVETKGGISYYDDDIHATIVINEANFDAGDVEVSVTKNGKKYPVKVSWDKDNVDVHTGTFTLYQDGDYVVSVRYKDKSGNKMKDYKSNQLTLDTAKPTVKVSNIKANTANKDEKYGFVITVSDTNLNLSSLKLSLKALLQNQTEPKEIDLGNARTVVSGQTYTYTVDNLPEDGLYTLTCSVADMASNGTSQIVLDDGASYDKVQFSINRNGSTFGYGNQFAEDLVIQYYIYSVNEDVVIVETNVDPIEQYKVMLNGEELEEGTGYTTTQTAEKNQWSKRTYTIKKEQFKTEGEYSIIISSVDKTQTTAYSDIKNLSMTFVVDQTKPVLTITGLENGGRYQTEAQTVTLIPTDEGGRLNNLKVVLLDADGNPMMRDGADISVLFDASGDKLLQYLADHDGQVTFTIPEGRNSKVRIICGDCVMSADDQANEYNELFERVTVSTSGLVIFFSNPLAVAGTIAGVLALIVLVIILVKRKKDKKNKS